MQEKKSGRPKQENPRSIDYHTRLTKAEHTRLIEQAKSLDYSSVSAYIRVLLFERNKQLKGKKFATIDPSELQKFRTSLTRIGVNLNQMARVLNAEQRVTKEAKHLARTQEELLVKNKKIIEMFER